MTLALFAAGPTLGWFIFSLFIALVIGLVVGAQVTSHEERALDYNLEDLELDELHMLEADASADGKAAIAKLKAAAARLKQLEQRVAQGVRKAL
jgi:uncharacterized membrane protein YraQ (UPF0718 family)